MLSDNKCYIWIMSRIRKYSQYEWILITVLLLGFLTRLLFLKTMPGGFNQDEASIGYEAYSLMKFGTDRNGISYPVHLISWGSGQNALYAYLLIPFIKILGLSEFSVRLPMALTGCLGLLTFNRILTRVLSKNGSLVATFIFAIAPWHIMKSRWALESNIFPDLILFSVFFIILGIEKKKSRYFYIASIILALSVYSYGTAYFFVPAFIILIIMNLLKNRVVRIKQIICPGIVLILLVIPILLFVYINTFDQGQIQLFQVTIPKLYVNRHTEKAAIFSGNILKGFYENFKNAIILANTGVDELPWNGIPIYGIAYNFSIIFAVIGVVKSYRIKNYISNLMNCWGLASLLTMAMATPNINRINVVWIPLIYYSAIGVTYCIEVSHQIGKIVIAYYILSFVLFIHFYSGDYQNTIRYYFFESFGEAVLAANNLDTDKIYVTDTVNHPYIYTLFYLQPEQNTFQELAVYGNKGTAFETVTSYGKFSYYWDGNMDDKTAVYIIPNMDAEELSSKAFDIKRFNRFSVVRIK